MLNSVFSNNAFCVSGMWSCTLCNARTDTMLNLTLTFGEESVWPKQLQGSGLRAAGQIRWATHIVITKRLSPLGGTTRAFFHWPPTISIQPSNHGLCEVGMSVANEATLHPGGVAGETWGVCEVLGLCNHARDWLHTQDLLCLGTNHEPLTYLGRLRGEVLLITHTVYSCTTGVLVFISNT